jgi:hypothetical protein
VQAPLKFIEGKQIVQMVPIHETKKVKEKIKKITHKLAVVDLFTDEI